eukprot:COSAG01_NODE_68770_length_263_cov_0.634146_1_plen_50_part_10
MRARYACDAGLLLCALGLGGNDGSQSDLLRKLRRREETIQQKLKVVRKKR